MHEDFSFTPLVILGAPRSGTNMLRDVLTTFPGVATWPCDEINLVWRRYNARWPDDALPASLASTKVCRYIRGAFAQRARRSSNPLGTVVEKTCANTLRVEFVDRVLPEARYIHIVRDGRDAIASAIERWTAPRDLVYRLRKARFAPLTELLLYAARSWRSVGPSLRSHDRRVRSWGPRFQDIDHWLATKPLAEVAAEQWRQCVLRATQSLARLPASRVIQVRYESLVSRPAAEVSRLLQFAQISYQSEHLTNAVRVISPCSIGRWRTTLDEAFAARVSLQVDDVLRALPCDEPVRPHGAHAA